VIVNLDKAEEFIRSAGNPIEQARLAYLLSRARPSPEVTDRLFAGQRSDGGWAPFWAKDYSSLDATCFPLAQADQLGLAAAEPPVQRAVQFLAQRQNADGSWEEDAQVASVAPPWVTPGDLDARLYLTANCGFWLALRGDPDHKAGKAADYLQARQESGGRLPGFLHTQWLADSLWHKLERKAAVEGIFEYLLQHLSDLAASNLSWLITTLSVAGLSPAHPLLGQAASILEQSQAKDGRWPSEDGPAQDVHSTLEALRAQRALRYCGRISTQDNDPIFPIKGE